MISRQAATMNSSLLSSLVLHSPSKCDSVLRSPRQRLLQARSVDHIQRTRDVEAGGHMLARVENVLRHVLYSLHAGRLLRPIGRGQRTSRVEQIISIISRLNKVFRRTEGR